MVKGLKNQVALSQPTQQASKQASAHPGQSIDQEPTRSILQVQRPRHRAHLPNARRQRMHPPSRQPRRQAKRSTRGRARRAGAGAGGAILGRPLQHLDQGKGHYFGAAASAAASSRRPPSPRRRLLYIGSTVAAATAAASRRRLTRRSPGFPIGSHFRCHTPIGWDEGPSRQLRPQLS